MSDEMIASLQKMLEVFMHRSMKNFILYLKEQDLTMSHVGTLFMLHRRETCSVSEIGDHLGITTAGTSQMLNRLVDEGLIERKEDAQDRRAKRIALTNKGKVALQDSIRARQNWLQQLVETLEPDERDQVAEMLHLLLEKAEQLEVPEVAHPL